MKISRMLLFVTATVLSLSMAATGALAGWEPERFAAESTLEIMTVDAEGGEHWFPIWLVVVDGDVFIRLGNRAADRVAANTRSPIVSVRIAGEEFGSVQALATPGMADAVGDAMAEKYFSDLFIRILPHPMTMRLVPVVRQAAAPPTTAVR